MSRGLRSKNNTLRLISDVYNIDTMVKNRYSVSEVNYGGTKSLVNMVIIANRNISYQSSNV